MTDFIISCYQARNTMSDDELLGMIAEGCNMIQDAVKQLSTQTEVAQIQRIQHAIVTMCAALGVIAPDMADSISYDKSYQKLVDTWKTISEDKHETD